MINSRQGGVQFGVFVDNIAKLLVAASILQTNFRQRYVIHGYGIIFVTAFTTIIGQLIRRFFGNLYVIHISTSSTEVHL